jgi:hypothetical protein
MKLVGGTVAMRPLVAPQTLGDKVFAEKRMDFASRAIGKNSQVYVRKRQDEAVGSFLWLSWQRRIDRAIQSFGIGAGGNRCGNSLLGSPSE